MDGMFRSIASIAVAGLLFIGCGNGISDQALEATGLKGAPQWVLNLGDGPYSGVGSAFIVDGDDDLARSEAIAQARAEIAKQIEVSVVSLVERNSERQDKSGTSKATSKIKEIAAQVMAGSQPSGFWISNDGSKAYVLVKLPLGSVQQIRKALKNEGVDYEAAERLMKGGAQAQQAPAAQPVQAAQQPAPQAPAAQPAKPAEEEW